MWSPVIRQNSTLQAPTSVLGYEACGTAFLRCHRMVVLPRSAGGSGAGFRPPARFSSAARPTSVHKRYLEDPVFLDLVQEEFERLTRAKDRWLTLSTVSPDDHAARILERLEVGPKVDKLDTRCGVIIIRDGKVAVIRKTLGPETFFNFPGGRGRTGESSGETAVREAFEELGLKIRLGPLVATWTSDWDGTHHYYLATEVEGEFGQGQGEDMMSGCTAMWMDPDEIKTADVRPKDVALALPFHSLGELPSPLHLRETIRRRTPVDE